MTRSKLSRRAFLLTATSTGLLLAGCADTDRNTTPAFYRNLAEPGARFDPNTMLTMVNGHRTNNGRRPVVLEPRLMALAQGYARETGDRARQSPTVRPDGRLDIRLTGAGYDAEDVRETVTAGYYTIAEAFSGWRDSSQHNATMLMEQAAHMGVAAQFMPNTKYKVYWVLVMAQPA
ncbi:MAG: CAP domain-containing protein [Pseudomonadota bacterium]